MFFVFEEVVKVDPNALVPLGVREPTVIPTEMTCELLVIYCGRMGSVRLLVDVLLEAETFDKPLELIRGSIWWLSKVMVLELCSDLRFFLLSDRGLRLNRSLQHFTFLLLQLYLHRDSICLFPRAFVRDHLVARLRIRLCLIRLQLIVF